MDRSLTWLAAAVAADPLECALLEIDVAIALVVMGAAVTVRLCGFPCAERAAVMSVARARAAGVELRVRRDSADSTSLLIGPRLDPADDRSDPGQPP